MPINYKRWEAIVDSSEDEGYQSEAPKKKVTTIKSRSSTAASGNPSPLAAAQAPLAAVQAPAPAVDLVLGRAALCSTMKDVRHLIES